MPKEPVKGNHPLADIEYLKQKYGVNTKGVSNDTNSTS